MRKKIEEARQAALDILQPDPKTLAQGLELHRDAVVCDAYGFSPTSAVAGAALKALAEAGASTQERRDRVEEMKMLRHLDDEAAREEYFEAWEASGVDCVVQNAGAECQSPDEVLKRHARFTYVAERLAPRVRKVTDAPGIEAAHREGAHALLFSANAVPLAEDWQSVEEELGFIRVFRQLGTRIMHLTYNRRNLLGDGCAEAANAGLSDVGRQAIREMNRVGIIVDVAHAGWRTSLEAAQASEVPMVASHSTAAAVHEHIRSKPDEVLRAIAETDGYCGVCGISGFLGGTGDLNRLLDHIEHMVKTVGARHVAIGLDQGYYSERSLEEGEKAGPPPRSRFRWGYYWGEAGLGLPPNHPSIAWTNWPMFTVGMLQRGLSETEIRQILGGNVLRVLTAQAV